MFGGSETESASVVLSTLRRELFFLVLGIAFATVGLISAAFTLLNRRFNALLFWFTVFALVYGLRLSLSLNTMHLLFPVALAGSLRFSLSYLVPIPAFFYFEAAGLLGRYGKRIAQGLATLFACLFIATVILGSRPIIEQINNVVLILALVLMVGLLARAKDAAPEYKVLRRGLLIFAALVFAGNISSLMGSFQNVEPIGFVYFLGTLGYVLQKEHLVGTMN